MSDTPRTDEWMLKTTDFVNTCIPFMRKLERELTAMTAERDALEVKLERKGKAHDFTRKMWGTEKAKLREVTAERDALKAAIVNLHKVQGRYQTQIAMKTLFDTASLP